MNYKEDLGIILGIERWARYGYPQLFWVEIGTKKGPLIMGMEVGKCWAEE